MLKTFFEKVPLKDGDVLVNYTSAVKDATLERLYRYTISRFDTDKIITGAEDFVSLIQARNAAWSNLGRMVEPMPRGDVPQTEQDRVDQSSLYRMVEKVHYSKATTSQEERHGKKGLVARECKGCANMFIVPPAWISVKPAVLAYCSRECRKKHGKKPQGNLYDRYLYDKDTPYQPPDERPFP